MDTFHGYPATALPLLEQIGANDRNFFLANKQQFTDEVLEPTRALIDALAPELHRDISDSLQVVPKVNGSISPITNDVRFHPVPPYKDYLLLRFWEGPDKASSATVFLRLSSTGIGFGAGWRFAGSDVGRYRQAVAGSQGAALQEALDELTRAGAHLIGDELKRVPAPYDADHPRSDLLRRKQLGVTWEEAVPKAVTSRRFVPWCARRLARTADVHRWLRDNV